MASHKVDSVPTNATTATVGATGDNASQYVAKQASGGSDPLAPSASHDVEQGLSGPTKSGPFSHENEVPAFDEKTHADPESIEALAAQTVAQNKGDAGFLSSLNAAEQKQEESGSTAI